MAGATFEGAPPAFQIPAGGSVSVTATSFGEEFVLKRPDGSLFAIAEVDAFGRTFAATFYNASSGVFVKTYQTYPEVLQPAPAESLSSAHVPNRNRRVASTCGAATWSDSGRKWTSGITWYFNSGSTPSGLSVDTTETYLRNAHAEWFNNTNWCGIADNSVFGMAYGGRTTLGYAQNGTNTVGFGDMSQTGCGAGVIACTATYISGTTIVEADTRLSSSLNWINGQAPGKYDVWSQDAHETGHVMGFNDVTDSHDNVMYFAGVTNDVSDQKLGKGDANGNNAKY